MTKKYIKTKDALYKHVKNIWEAMREVVQIYVKILNFIGKIDKIL